MPFFHTIARSHVIFSSLRLCRSLFLSRRAIFHAFSFRFIAQVLISAEKRTASITPCRRWCRGMCSRPQIEAPCSSGFSSSFDVCRLSMSFAACRFSFDAVAAPHHLSKISRYPMRVCSSIISDYRLYLSPDTMRQWLCRMPAAST